MRCKICRRRLKDPVSVDRGVGPVCAIKLESDQAELFDIPQVAIEVDDRVQYESYPLERKFSYQIQIGLNFNPAIRQDMTAIEKHAVVNKLLGLQGRQGLQIGYREVEK